MDSGGPLLTVERMVSLRDAGEDWTELAQASANIFSTWEWADTWWGLFGSGHALDLAVLRARDGTTTAVLPMLCERHRAFRVTRFIGHGVADELGPVCAPENRAAAARALDALGGAGDVLLAENLRSDWPWKPVHGRVLKEDSSPVISLTRDGSWEEYLGSHSPNFRQQVRRRTRRLSRELDLRYRQCVDPARLDADLDLLFGLHRARWGPQAPAFAGRRETFHRRFAARALERGWLRLWLAESDGAAVAAWYGFRFAGIESFYQAGRDPRLSRYSLGAGILEHSIREAFADGMREYRLLRGDEAYKQRYETSRQTVATVAVPRSVMGRGIVRVADALSEHDRGRRLLSRIGGR